MQALTNIAKAISARISGAPVTNTTAPDSVRTQPTIEDNQPKAANTIVIPHDVQKSEYSGRMDVHKDLTPLPLVLSTKEDMSKIGLHFITKEADSAAPAICVAVHAENTFDKVHYSYPYYLFECFANHYGAVVTPDVLWFTALISFSKYVAANAEELRNKFVDFEGNREIRFLPESSHMDDWLSDYLDAVRKDIKMDSQLLFPSFSTSTEKSRLALQVAVCDLVSPYFTGMVLSCGIPHITIEGTIGDYNIMKNAAIGMADHFKDDDPLRGFFSRIADRADSLSKFLSKENDGTFLRDFFLCKNCSSGHPTYKVSGWVTELLTVGLPSRGLFLKDSGLNCAVVKFKEQGCTTKLACLAGVFNSTYDKATNTLHPQFDRFWIRYNPAATPIDQDDD